MGQGQKAHADLIAQLRGTDILDAIANSERALGKIAAGNAATRLLGALASSHLPFFQVIQEFAARETTDILGYRPCSPDEMVMAVMRVHNHGVGEMIHDVNSALKVAGKIQREHGVVDAPWGPDDHEALARAKTIWKET